MIVLVVLIISVDSFASGSASDSKGSRGGDSSAAVENVNQFEVTKISNKVKKPLSNTYSSLKLHSLFSYFYRLSSVMNIFFVFLYYFMGHSSAAIFPYVSEKFSTY
jgi:hypothetical protein